MPYLNLGLVCINTILRSQEIFCSRTCNRNNFTVEKAMEKSIKNIRDIKKLIEWNEKNGIYCFRISSDLFPHFTDKVTEKYSLDFAIDELKIAGEYINKLGHRIVMHPGQYNNVGTNDPNVFQSTINDLKMHADILDYMNIDQNGCIIVHGGGVYGNKEETINRWIKQFHMLPENVKKRLVLENCEFSYNTDDCLRISAQIGIPVVFDFHHYNCWNIKYGKESQRTIEELFPDVIKTWTRLNRRVLMHLSEQSPNGKLGAHSDFIEEIPNVLFRMMFKYNINIDLEIEAKMKEQAIKKLYQKYPFLDSTIYNKPT